MNATTQYIMGIYQLAMIVRDTLGYVVPRKENFFKKDIYEHRAKSFALLTAEGSPFSHFLSLNEEKAEKLVKNINDFQTELYSSESRIFRVSGDHVEVDQSQAKQVYNMTIGIYQTLLDILKGYLTHARASGELEARVAEVIAADEYYFRSLAHYALVNDLFKLFKEYSEAMRAHNGESNPVAKFINEDINELTKYVAFMDQHNEVKNVPYKKMVDMTKAFVENMSGRRDLPEGKNFPEVFNELNDFALHTLQDAEVKWREIFVPLAKDYQDYITKENERKNPQDLA